MVVLSFQILDFKACLPLIFRENTKEMYLLIIFIYKSHFLFHFAGYSQNDIEMEHLRPHPTKKIKEDTIMFTIYVSFSF